MCHTIPSAFTEFRTHQTTFQPEAAVPDAGALPKEWFPVHLDIWDHMIHFTPQSEGDM